MSGLKDQKNFIVKMHHAVLVQAISLTELSDQPHVRTDDIDLRGATCCFLFVNIDFFCGNYPCGRSWESSWVLFLMNKTSGIDLCAHTCRYLIESFTVLEILPLQGKKSCDSQHVCLFVC